MDAGKLWSMLIARGLQPGGSSRGFGDLTPEDVRGALQGMKRGPFSSAMVIRCADRNSLQDLRGELWRAIRGLSRAENWQAHKTRAHGRIDVLLSNLVILEQCEGGRGCPGCAGRGLIELSVQPEQCGVCSGTGRVRLLERDKASYCDITPVAWSYYWTRRYAACYDIVTDWLGAADRHIKRKLRTYQEVA